MLVTVARLALGTAAMALLTASFTTSADAQRVHPRCAKSKDPVRCSCALYNGGYTTRTPDGRSRIVVSDTGRVNEGHVRCMLRNGRS